MKSTPFFLHINGMVAWRDLHLTRMNGTLWADGSTMHKSSLNRIEYNKIQNRNAGLACLKGLVDLFSPVLVRLFHRQLCLFELQELAPKKLKIKIHKKKVSISMYFCSKTSEKKNLHQLSQNK